MAAITGAQILFSHAGGDGFGLLLDSVGLESSDNGVAPIPEPSSALLLLTGLAVVPWMHRRSQRA